MSKYFENIPSGYTKNYYFKLSNGKCFYKYHSEADEQFVFTFCTNFDQCRKAILKKLFGEDNIHAVIRNKNIMLPQFNRLKLPDSKIQSIGNKYSTIHAKYLWYYPNLDRFEEKEVIEDENNSYYKRK